MWVCEIIYHSRLAQIHPWCKYKYISLTHYKKTIKYLITFIHLIQLIVMHKQSWKDVDQPSEHQEVFHRFCVTEGIAAHPALYLTCGCLAYYYGLAGWWSLNELDTEMSSWLWCVVHQGGRVELVWSSASHLTHVNSSNESGLFLGGLFFISRVRGCRPQLAGWLSGRQLKRKAEEWG